MNNVIVKIILTMINKKNSKNNTLQLFGQRITLFQAVAEEMCKY